MKGKDYLPGILAGLVAVVLWYGMMFLSWLHILSTEILFYGYPLIPAVLLVLLLKHRLGRWHTLAKIGLSFLSAFLFYRLGSGLNLAYVLLNIATPGYGNLSAGGGFGVMLMSFSYFAYCGMALLFSFCFTERKKAAGGEAENRPAEKSPLPEKEG